MPPVGPQQFDLPVYDTYQTYDPEAPIVGTQIEGTVGVTINWNLSGTDLTTDGVQFADPLWTGPGNGPLSVFDNAIGGGVKQVGSVSWSIVTHALKVVETDTPNGQIRWAITPVVQLIRAFTSTIGAPSDTEVVNTNSDTVRGVWMPQPK